MITKTNTFKLNGINAVPVTVECEITTGLGIHLVGLADTAVKESLLRTITAIQSLGYRIPGKKVVINLAPADLRKGGSGYDLPIALGILAASGQEKLPDLDKYVLAGELGLDGSLRDIPGWMQAAELASKTGKCCILPTESAKLAARALQGSATVYGADNIKEVIDILNDGAPDWTALDVAENCDEPYEQALEHRRNWWDTTPGHASEKRALEIAAAGGHPVLMIGAPGSEKKALAQALLDILPPMTEGETMDVQRIYSAADCRNIPGERPIRSVYSIPSLAALVGGGYGNNLNPGMASLAHNGILYIDQLAEMPKSILEALRGPLEDGKVVLSRLRSKVEYPTKFFPVFATNPCPCGYWGEGDKCTCTKGQREAYLAHLSGPVFDRLTMQIFTHTQKPGAVPGEPSATVAERVKKARERQMARQGKLNDGLTRESLETVCRLDEECSTLMENLFSRLGLSARAYTRILKIARTIADLDGTEAIMPKHLAEAFSYRFLDRREMAGIQVGDTVHWNDEAGTDENGKKIEFKVTDEENGYFNLSYGKDDPNPERWAFRDEVNLVYAH